MKFILARGLSVLFVLCTCATTAWAGETGRTGVEAVREAERQGADAESAAAEKADRSKTWVFSLYSGVQYDDNITLRSMGVDVENQDRTDWKSVHAFQADYRAVNTEERVIGLRYRLYQAFIDVNSNLQLTGHTVTGYYTASRAPHLFYVPVSFSHYKLAWHSYLNVHGINPTIFVEQSPHAVGVFRAGWQRYNFYHVPNNDFDENDRDADVYTLGGEEWFMFGGRAEYRLELAYTFRKEVAADEEWSSVSHKVRVGCAAQLPWWQLSAGAFTAYEARDYAKRNPAFEEVQEDDVMTYGLSLSRPLWKNARVTMSYLFTDHESTVTSQDYERNQVTLGVIVNF